MTESNASPPISSLSVPDYSFYTSIQKQRLDIILEQLIDNGNQCFVNDLFDLLEYSVTQCKYISQDSIPKLLKLSEAWNRRKIHLLHRILRQDLRIRPNEFNSTMVDELFRCVDSCLQLTRQVHNNHSKGGTKFQAVQLALNYFVEVLTKYSSSLSINVVSSYPMLYRTTKWPFYSKIIKSIFNISHLAKQDSNDSIYYHNLQNDLFMLLCAPMCSSNSPKEIAQTISFCFEVQLREMPSISDRRRIIELIPSCCLKEKIIDIHLTEEFSFHPSMTVLDDDSTKPFGLNKFCFVHLCRMPYYRNGTLHDLSYFLFLLYSLLENHLLLATGIQPLSPYSPLKQQSASNDELQSVLDSIKPHVAGLIDRLSEDEVLLTQLVESCCWSEIQRLSNIIDTVMTSLSF